MKRLLACLALCASLSASAQDDCQLFNIQEIAAELQNTTLDTAIVQTDGSIQVELSNGNTFELIFGCTDNAYTEYSASANLDDGSCATVVVNGCMDIAYVEYNSSANTNDGSCATFVVEGCTNPDYIEYSALANTNDGSCATLIVLGCIDPTYTEFDAAANVDDGSCSTLAPPCSSVEMDGYIYSTVEIGDQCWFAENLRTTTYQNGDVITTGLTDSEWDSTTSGATAAYGEGSSYCAQYNIDLDACDETQSLEEYGRLYNWYAVDDARNLCPSGWHVPTADEWSDLQSHISSQGFSGSEGTALKSTYGWYNGGNGTVDLGFSALPGGYRHNLGFFEAAGTNGMWWSSSPNGDFAYGAHLGYYTTDFSVTFGESFDFGLSVRCLLDAE